VRRLESLRLVQWYHFQDEVVALGNSTLLLGDNGSGKSTILDALQLGLVADLQEVRFNQAANEKGKRTLYGYVRHKLGHEDEGKGGAVRYGRASATSYIILEFRGDDPQQDFCAGIGLEATEADGEVARYHFVVPAFAARDVAVLAQRGAVEYVRPLREFRAWIREQPQGDGWTDPGTYREELRQRLGVLPESFHRLIVKALSFKPIGQVRQFVFDYLLDPKPIDTGALRANLEHYKRLEGEAKQAEERLVALDEIAADGERIAQERRVATSHHFLELRADLEIAQDRLRDVRARQEENTRLGAEAAAALIQVERELESLSRELERIGAALGGHDVYRQLKDLDRQLLEITRALEEAEAADVEGRRLLKRQTEALERLTGEEARALRRRRPGIFEDEELVGIAEPPAIVERLRQTLTAEGALSGRDLQTWERRLDKAHHALALGKLTVDRELRELREEGRGLQQELDALDRGQLRYPDGPSALLHLLASRLKGKREARPLCELLEVANPRWRDAVEGYLNTRRFDVLVDPSDYPRALSLYERHKRDYPLPGRGTVFIAGVGLVDLEKISTQRPDPRSLANQVETEDPRARTYVDYLLGDVICVDDEQELRRHRAAITDTVMVYRGHVARQTGRETYARHYCGQAAKERRRNEVKERLALVAATLIEGKPDLDWLEEMAERVDKVRLEAVRLPELIERAASQPTLQLQKQRLVQQRGRLDLREVEVLEETQRELNLRRQDKGSERDRHRDVIAKAEERATGLARDDAQRQEALTAAEGALGALPIQPTSRPAFEERYAEERKERSPEQVHLVFERMRRSIEGRVEGWVRALVAKKTTYVDHWGLAVDTTTEDVAPFLLEREVWRDSRLPEYRAKIADAKSKALEQLAEDVIFRLRENLLGARRQLEELNKALKDVPFGSERYQFTMEPEADKKDFYDLVMNAGLFPKESLFGQVAMGSNEVRVNLRDFVDRLVEAEAEEVKTALEERADYREYFRYDLKIIHADGHYSLYDRVAADKSGGETQTPYYIAILASMHRMYRSGRGVQDGQSAGLVLLDEAFGKMDGERIAATLVFARRLGLQLIMATPKERSDLVAPRVERSIYVHKDPLTGAPTLFDVTKELAHDQPGPELDAGGAPPPPAG
jgi:uncharacterized protein YPO0396